MSEKILIMAFFLVMAENKTLRCCSFRMDSSCLNRNEFKKLTFNQIFKILIKIYAQI